MSFEWTSNDLQKEFLMPNQKIEEKYEGLNSDWKLEWAMMLKF
jgi:hypothetical protein